MIFKKAAYNKTKIEKSPSGGNKKFIFFKKTV